MDMDNIPPELSFLAHLLFNIQDEAQEELQQLWNQFAAQNPGYETKEEIPDSIQQKRINLILKLYEKNTPFVPEDNPLATINPKGLLKDYYKVSTPHFNGYIAEQTVLDKLISPTDYAQIICKYELFKPTEDRENRLESIRYACHHDWVQKTKKPCLIHDDGVIYVVTPEMSLDEIENQAFDLKEKKQEQENKKLKKFLKDLPELKLINEQYWDNIIQENIQNTSSEVIGKMLIYGSYLQKIRDEKKQPLTAQDIKKADNKAHLSCDALLYSADEQRFVRFEGPRFWADIIFSRTWIYGKELLLAEGFTEKETLSIQNDFLLSTDYEYWEHKINVKEKTKSIVEFLRSLYPTPPKKIRWNGPKIDDDLRNSKIKED